MNIVSLRIIGGGSVLRGRGHDRWRGERVKSFIKMIRCKVLQSHNWTSAAEEGLKPTQEQLAKGVDGFLEYAKMYCKDCGGFSTMP